MPDAFYIYCIGERDALLPLLSEKLPEAIEPEAGLQLIEAGEVAAVSSNVPLADYGDEMIETRLADPVWMALRAMRHEKVLEHFAARASLVPLRFGTIYLKRAGVEQMLAERATELRAIIERLRGREEWGVNIFCERAKLLEVIATLSPALREMSARADAASAGQAYLLRKKIDAMRTDEARVEIKRVAGEIERELTALSDGATRLRMRQADTTEQSNLAAKLAFLVERTRFDEFRAAAERLAESHLAAGFQLELTGPWPAYNFAEELK